MRSRPKGVPVHPSSDKLAMIRSGKKKKTVTGFKEDKKITFSNEQGKFIAVEKEKKFEEAGVTKKRENFIMFESKLGTEKERDMHKIEGAKHIGRAKDRVEERIISKRKRKEYLDNYQYHETKDFKEGKPAIVIHERMGDIVGGIFETTTVEKTTVRGGSSNKNRGGNDSATLRGNKSTGNLNNIRPTRPQQETTATKTKESTTKVGRRGGAGGKTSTTTTTKQETKTTSKGGERTTSTKTSTSKKTN